MAELRLLGRLALHGYLFSGEVAATWALAVLMDDPVLEAALLEAFGLPGTQPDEQGLQWRAESKQGTYGRLDVVAFRRAVPAIVIEAKFGDPIERGQLGSYLEYMGEVTPTDEQGESLFVLLVPQDRRPQADRELEATIGVAAGIRRQVMTWEEVVHGLTSAAETSEGHAKDDVQQFASLVEVGLNLGFPAFDADTPRAWIETRFADLVSLVDLLSTRYILNSSLAGSKRNPLQQKPVPGLACGRYHWNSPEDPEFILGVPALESSMADAAPLVVYVKAAEQTRLGAVDRLRASSLRLEVGDSGVWVPLDIVPGMPPQAVLDSLGAQLDEFDRALRGLPGLDPKSVPLEGN